MGKAEKVQPTTVALAPPSGQPPSGNLARRDAMRLALELSNYFAKYSPLFARSKQREWAQLYLRGQLSDLERKSRCSIRLLITRVVVRYSVAF